jgi:catechol 2,3-dioxygenase-like lactoylglutathione lyase family enzyme
MNLSHIDHVVFTVRDIDVTCDFYTRALGMEIVSFAGGRKALQCGRCKLNLHEYGHEFEPKAERPAPGTQDICLITEEPLSDVMAHLQQAGVAVLEGPVPRTGALGSIESIYLRDPDGNLIEVARYLDKQPDS